MLNESSREQRYILVGATILFFVLLVMSQLFYKERLFADSSYYATNIVQWERFRFDHDRFILIFAEWLPLLGIKLGLSLEGVLRLYSIGHVIYFLGIFLLTYFVIKNHWAALAILLVHITNTLFLYFTPMVEIWYGAGLSILFYALLLQNNASLRRVFILVLIEITVLFSHPENFVLILTFLAFKLEQERKVSKASLALILAFFASLVFKFLTFSSYEAEKVNHALDIEGSQDTMHLLDADYLGTLLTMLYQNYTAVLLFFLISCIYMLKQKKWLQAGILFFSFFGIIGVVNSVTTANIYDWYFEAMYLPLVALAIAVFFSHGVQLLNTRAQTQLLLLLGVFSAYTLAMQWKATGPYTIRANQLMAATIKLTEKRTNKFIIKPQEMGLTGEDMTWSIPMETLLLSALKGKEHTVSVGTPDDIGFEEVNKILSDSSYFMLRRWDLIKNEQLNSKYFSYKPGAYVEVELN